MSSSSARSVALTIETMANWYGDPFADVEISKSGDGANVTYAADWEGAAVWVAPASAAIENHTIEIDFKASPEFKASEGNLYIYAIFKDTPWTKEEDCSWFMSADIVAGTSQTISCTVSTGGGFSQTAIAIEIRLVARVETGKPAPSGTVLITGGRVLAP